MWMGLDPHQVTRLDHWCDQNILTKILSRHFQGSQQFFTRRGSIFGVILILQPNVATLNCCRVYYGLLIFGLRLS